MLETKACVFSQQPWASESQREVFQAYHHQYPGTLQSRQARAVDQLQQWYELCSWSVVYTGAQYPNVPVEFLV